MGIRVKKENTNAIIIYINTITHDYTVSPSRGTIASTAMRHRV